MAVFFTADHHFGHRAIIDYAERPFESVEVMDETMIGTWNARVGRKDEVYYLGDLSLCRTERTREIVNRLNGRIYFIRGNHDKALKGSVTGRFSWTKHYYELKYQGAGIRVKGADATRIILSHFPFEVWEKSHFGSWHLHGHCHGSLVTTRDIRRMDVGVDTREDYAPYSLEEVEAILSKRGYQAVDHHRGPTRSRS
jgi:calcineurin-like phosphoesterase family protein